MQHQSGQDQREWKWRCPTRNTLKMNCDAATFRGSKCSSWECILRNSAGEFLGARSYRHPILMDPTMAKAIAVKRALSWCVNTSLQHVTIKTDSEIFKKAISATHRNTLTLGQVIADCK